MPLVPPAHMRHETPQYDFYAVFAIVVRTAFIAAHVSVRASQTQKLRNLKRWDCANANVFGVCTVAAQAVGASALELGRRSRAS